ncbi:MAG: hypothetical protein Q7K57_45140 [Burkholderiaceae bacterium]|nr:hypothetical protein [Burkholderiaceae bacterium]
MTRTVLFTNHAPAGRTSAGLRTSSAPSLVRQVLDAAKTMLAAFAAGRDARQADHWLTPSIRRNMSVRAQRLMRADY